MSASESRKYIRANFESRVPGRFRVVVHTFAEDVNVDDVEFGENPNAVLVATFSEYYLSHSPANALRWLVAELDKLER